MKYFVNYVKICNFTIYVVITNEILNIFTFNFIGMFVTILRLSAKFHVNWNIYWNVIAKIKSKPETPNHKHETRNPKFYISFWRWTSHIEKIPNLNKFVIKYKRDCDMRSKSIFYCSKTYSISYLLIFYENFNNL